MQSRLITAVQAGALIGVRASYVRRDLATRLGETIIGFTPTGKPRKRYDFDLCAAFAAERAERLAAHAARAYERDRRAFAKVKAPKFLPDRGAK